MPRSTEKLTLAEIGRLFYVIPEEGWIFWKCGLNLRGVQSGRPAGRKHCRRPRDYHRVIVGRRAFPVHCIIWACVHGEWPDDELDHIDRDPGNNRIDNLRLSEGKNHCNIPKMSNNKSGLKWVYWHHSDKKWRGSVGVATDNGKRYYMKGFSAPEEAYAWSWDKAWELHGEFFHHGFDPGKYPMHPMDVL